MENNSNKLEFIENPYDLNNLEILNPEEVKNFVEELKKIPKEETRSLIIAVGTGGTISMKRIKKDGQEVLVPELDFEKIFEKTEPTLKEKFLVKSFDAYQIDSSQMQISNVHDLVIFMSFVYKNIGREDFGFLILHGTDTMAEASNYLAMQLGKGLKFPVCYTGAQKSIQESINDAANNVKHALYTLDCMKTKKIAEVVITFGDAVLLAVGSKKISDMNCNAFDTYMHELLNDISTLKYPLEFPLWIRRKDDSVQYNPKIFSGDSHLITIYSNMSINPKQIKRQIRDENVFGVLLVTYGAGTADKKITHAIAEVIKEKKISAFAVSPVNSDPSLGDYESGKELPRLGIYPVYMTLAAAKAKFEIVFREFKGDVEKIVEYMNTQYIGEIPTEVSKRRSSLLRH